MKANTFEIFLNIILLHLTYKLKTNDFILRTLKILVKIWNIVGYPFIYKTDWYLFGILIFATESQICCKPSDSKILTFSLTTECQSVMWSTLTNHWYARSLGSVEGVPIKLVLSTTKHAYSLLTCTLRHLLNIKIYFKYI